MVLLMLLWIILCAVISIILGTKCDKPGSMLIVIFCMFFPLLGLIPLSQSLPISEYSKSAEVTIDDYNGTIFFNDFTQDDRVIVINEYATKNIHWLDFNFVDVVKEPLEIILLNNGTFMYHDRLSNSTDNEIHTATQP